MTGREKRPLGDLFGLTVQDEFIYLLEGHAVLVTDEGETALSPGMCVGFKAGTGNGHQPINRSNADVVYLEVGDRSAGDASTYPDDDLKASLGPDGKYLFKHKDGTTY